MLCLPCLGTGKYPGKKTCPRCKGRGDLPDTRLNNPMCPYCVGKGRDPFRKGQLCSVCDGWGRLPTRSEPRRAPDKADAAAKPPETEMALQPEDTDPLNHTYRGDSDQLEDLLGSMVGDVDVCEPWLAAESLDRLRLLRRCDLIRVLTHDIDGDLLRGIREFTQELPRFLFRRYSGREIRDRYLLTPDEIIFLGPHSGDGNGESPILIRVPASVAGETIQDVRLGFNRLWSAGDRLG